MLKLPINLILSSILVLKINAQLLEIFGLSTGDSGTVNRPIFSDLARFVILLTRKMRNLRHGFKNRRRYPIITIHEFHQVAKFSLIHNCAKMKVKHLPFSQSMGLINYLRTVQKDPKHNLESK